MRTFALAKSRKPLRSISSGGIVAKQQFLARALTLAIVATSTGAWSQPSPPGAQASVIRTDDARLRARATADVQALSRIYAQDYILITAEGAVRTREDQLSELAKGQLHFAPLVPLERHVRLYGRTALVISRDPAGIVRNGQEIGGDLRMTRVYLWRDHRWQLIAAQATRVVQP